METQTFVVEYPGVQAMAGGIDLDLTAVAAGLLFLLVYVLLKFVLFDPYLKIVDERDRKIDGAQRGAASMRAEAAATLASYEERMGAARREAAALRDGLRAEAEVSRSKVVDEARREAGEALAARRERMAQEMAVADAALEAEARQIGQLIVSRVLGARS